MVCYRCISVSYSVSRASDVAESLAPTSGVTPASEFGAALSSISDSLGMTVSSHQRALAYTMWRLQVTFLNASKRSCVLSDKLLNLRLISG